MIEIIVLIGESVGQVPSFQLVLVSEYWYIYEMYVICKLDDQLL